LTEQFSAIGQPMTGPFPGAGRCNPVRQANLPEVLRAWLSPSLLGGQQSLFGVRMTVQKAGETAARRRPPLGCRTVYSHSEQNIQET
jgi:hypothetical protein